LGITKENPIHVLHVDNDPSCLEVSKDLLMDMGNFEIDHACCVDEAFKKLASHEKEPNSLLQYLRQMKLGKLAIGFNSTNAY